MSETISTAISAETAHLAENGPVLATHGDLCVRLAVKKREIKAAQALRYRIFYKGMGAQAKWRHKLSQRDADRFDSLCDHLLLTTRAKIDDAPKKTVLKTGETVVGCYRVLRRAVAESQSGFYSAAEYDLGPLLNGIGRGLNILELGRSCIAPEFRSGRGISLLWRGLGQMIEQYDIDAMMGCASFSGADPHALALPLSYLYHKHRADGLWAVRAHSRHFVDMNLLPFDEIDEKAALRALPPVLRGYIRSGAMIGDGAVIDRQFNTVDVFVLMPVSDLSDRVRNRYAA